jgi:hypothetical protein
VNFTFEKLLNLSPETKNPNTHFRKLDKLSLTRYYKHNGKGAPIYIRVKTRQSPTILKNPYKTKQNISSQKNPVRKNPETQKLTKPLLTETRFLTVIKKPKNQKAVM